MIFILQLVYSQNQTDKNIFWFKAVQNGDSLIFDMKNNDTIPLKLLWNEALVTSCPHSTPISAAINFNPVIAMNDSSLNQLKIPLKLKGKKAKTLLVVYQVLDSLNKNAIWTYKLNSEKCVGLSSQELITMNKKYIYNDSNSHKPFINAIIFNINEQASDSNTCILLGKNDSLNFNGFFAEALLFDKHLKGNELIKWQTYLAIKYGIKLQEINYMNSNDTIIWEYTPDFNSAIAGIGRDSVYSLNQKQSRSMSEEDLVTLGAGAIDTSNVANPFAFDNFQSIVWAHNGLGAELEYDPTNTKTENTDYMYYSKLQRKWLLRTTGTGTSAIRTQLQFDGTALHVAPGDEFYLIIDRSATRDFTPANAILIEPDSITPNGVVYFNDLLWDTDNSGKDMFTFSFIKIFTSEFRNEEISSDWLNQNANAFTGKLEKENISGEGSYSLYPNPTSGEYMLEVISDKETSFNVRLLDVSGRVVKITEKPVAKQLSMKDVLPGKGIYFLEVRTDHALKIFKVVMK